MNSTNAPTQMYMPQASCRSCFTPWTRDAGRETTSNTNAGAKATSSHVSDVVCLVKRQLKVELVYICL